MTEKDKSTEKLPNWDLTDLYPSYDSKEFNDDMKKAGMLSEKFATRYKGNIEKLSGKDFGESIKDYEKLQGLIGKMGNYAYMLYSTEGNNEKITGFYNAFEEKATEYGNKTLFYGLEINKLSDENLAEKMKDSNVAHYKPWLDNVRSFRKHDLTEDLEKMSSDKSLSGKSAWVRFYEQKMASLRYKVDDKEYTEASLSPLFESPDRETRKKALEARNKVLKENIKDFAFITNVLALDKKVDDEKRGFKEPYESRNLANNVENKVVDALVSSVSKNYKNTSHRYYDLKAKWLGLDKLEAYDKFAPLPEVPQKKYSWEEAKEIVLNAFNEFSPDMAKIGKKFFDNNWIDVPPKDGKRAGAYAMPGTKDTHSYLLLNFQGTAGDVMTLAHELGHGVHQELAKDKGDLMADTPLTLAETASVFGEMLTFKYMLKHEKDPKVKFSMIAEKTQDMLGTSASQIAFHSYETDVHKERREKGELSVERLNEIWTKHQKESNGPSVNVADTGIGWARIPHLIRSPFYVYAYSFGDCLVNSLYKTYEEGKVPDFQKKYLEMLSKGGTEKHKEMLAPLGLDASKPDFWDKGLKVISGFVDELEKLTKELGMDKTKNQPVKSDVIVKNAKQNKR